MSLLYKAQQITGYQEICSPKNSELDLITFGRLVLAKAGESWNTDTGADEVALDILGGRVTVTIQSPAGPVVYEGIGERENMFGGKPATVYIPRNSKYTVKAESDNVDVAVMGAPARRDTNPAYIAPDDIIQNVVGKDNWQRDVWTQIGPNVDADRLLVGETFNPPGNWSSAPPHKHDVNNPPAEGYMEEVYFYQVTPKQGFGIQRVYSGETSPKQINDAYVVEDGDTVAIPYGYHPIVAGPGYRVSYLWVLAGDERAYGAWSDDPKHAWLRNS